MNAICSQSISPLLLVWVGFFHWNRHAVPRWSFQRVEKREDVREFLLLQQHAERRHGRDREVLKSFGEFCIRVHEAFNDVGFVGADGDSIEDGTNVAALAFYRVAGSTSGDGAVVEQNLTTLRIACGNFHFLHADARDFVNATKQGERVVQGRIVGIGGDAWKLGDDGLDFGNGRELGEFHKRNLARENRAPPPPTRGRVHPRRCRWASQYRVLPRRVADQNPPAPACSACCLWGPEAPGTLPAPGGAHNSAPRRVSAATEAATRAKLPKQISPSG